MDSSVPSNQSLASAARAALQQGRKLEAIKIVREIEGLGLKEAKDRVDRCVADDPLLRERFSASESRMKKGCLVVAAGLIALLGIGVFFFVRAQG
jgi:ribosomal protein L7/L12